MRVILDTCVLVAAIRSRLGRSHAVMELIGTGAFATAVTVPIVLEYESALLRHAAAAGLSPEDVGVIVDYVCAASEHVEVFYLWRPILRDPDDDHVLEAAVAAGCDAIVTFNVRDFSGAARLGLDVITPGELMRRTGAKP